MKINTEDNLENCPDCGEDMPGGNVRCTRCQRQHEIENMTEDDYRAHEALFPSASIAPQLPLITYTVGVKSVSDMLTQQEQQRYKNAIHEAIKAAYPAYDVVVTLDSTIGGADSQVSNDPYGETDIAEHTHSIAHSVWIGAAWLDK
ncbi:TPA: hypothetical protein ACGY9K_002607 [Escherichia coli]|uniref:hypothetical protein n=1 Tax=Citrobacter TaxID=544 RepID=UPI00126A9E46|nr:MULTISPECIES: hypothetical protein [Citrobacter]ECE8410947.1 hypothetical protein [Salmonella enterica subsp. enterica serovar Anatum]ECL5445078.1 hypothetical protein [Salmonella enterica]EDM7166756.1 hypothetical protein [Salmonella enterica subsp. enterica serovar Litchfield]EFE0694109.1 hypothetical protein [Escherichia coli]EIH3568189.1 hypothetical protein [Escherichia coli]